LQNLAGELPLVMTEIGLDSRRNGRRQQAAVLDWQIQAAFEAAGGGDVASPWPDARRRGGHARRGSSFPRPDPRRRAERGPAAPPASGAGRGDAGPASQSWSAPRTAPPRSATRSRAWRASTIPATR